MLGIASKCRVGLWVTKQHPWLDKESEGSSSSGYVLVNFQIQTHSRGQPKTDYPIWTQAKSTEGHTRENHHYKRGLLKIGYCQEGKDEPEYFKPRIISQVAPSLRPYPLNGVERLSTECQPLTTSSTGHLGLAVGKRRRWEKLSLSVLD